MNLQQLIKKYPQLKSCVESYGGDNYLNMAKVRTKVIVEQNSTLQKDLENYSGYILLDGYDNDLGNDQILHS